METEKRIKYKMSEFFVYDSDDSCNERLIQSFESKEGDSCREWTQKYP